MPKRYSPEIRRTALELVNQGQTQIEVVQALGVSPKWGGARNPDLLSR